MIIPLEEWHFIVWLQKMTALLWCDWAHSYLGGAIGNVLLLHSLPWRILYQNRPSYVLLPSEQSVANSYGTNLRIFRQKTRCFLRKIVRSGSRSLSTPMPPGRTTRPSCLRVSCQRAQPVDMPENPMWAIPEVGQHVTGRARRKWCARSTWPGIKGAGLEYNYYHTVYSVYI